MRFAVIAFNYDNFLAELYGRHPEWPVLSYADQMSRIHARCFGTADFYSDGLRACGHEARDFIWNNDHLQTAWCRENAPELAARRPGDRRALHGWLTAVLEEQLRRYRPDVIFHITVYDFSPEESARLAGHTRLFVGQCAYPLRKDRPLNHVDLMLSSLPPFVERFRSMGLRAEHLPLGFDPRITERLAALRTGGAGAGSPESGEAAAAAEFGADRLRMPEAGGRAVESARSFSSAVSVSETFRAAHGEAHGAVYRDASVEGLRGNVGQNVGQNICQNNGQNNGQAGRDIDVIFTGGFCEQHRPRTDFLEEVARRLDIRFHGYTDGRGFPPGSAIAPGLREPVWGLAMFELLARAKIVLNAHAPWADGWANNMRMYEATGMGACLVTENSPNIRDFFEPGAQAAVYGSAGECVRVVRELLGNRTLRESIARAGQARTLRDHTYRARAGQLARLCAEALRAKEAA